MSSGTTALPAEDAAALDAPLQVVHLVSTLNIGGLEKVVYDLVRFADRGCVAPRVVCLGEIGVLGRDFEGVGIPVESVDVLGKGVVRAVRRLARRLRELRPDVLHTHNPMPHLIGALAARLARVPAVVHTKHGRNYPHIKKRVLGNRIASWLTDRVVPVSGDSADVARRIEKVPAGKIQMIWNGIDLERFQHRERPGNGRPTAIHVARLIYPTKDQITLLKAVRIVADAEPRFQLDIVGDGPHREMIETLCDELKLRPNVNFLGFRDDVHELLTHADFFVLSSVKEGLSLTLLEAMASGLPIVATRVGGNPEVVVDGETGFLVPAQSPEELARGMLEMIRDPQRTARMGIAGRRRVEEHFDVRRVTARYEALYRSLVPRAAKHRRTPAHERSIENVHA